MGGYSAKRLVQNASCFWKMELKHFEQSHAGLPPPTHSVTADKYKDQKSADLGN